MRTSIYKALITAIALVCGGNSLLLAQENGKSDNVTPGQVLDKLLERVKFTGYLQAGYAYDDEASVSTSSYNIKRAILWADVQITDRFSARFMYNFCSVVQDAYLDYRITNGPELNVRVGQFKNSFSHENPVSLTSIECINGTSQAVSAMCGVKGDPLYGTNYGRDMGMKIFGDIFNKKFHYELAIMNGQGVNTSDGNSDKDIIVKLDYRPLTELRIVATGQKGRGHAVGTAAWNPDIEVGDNYRRDRLSFGGEWKSQLLGLRAEWLGGKDGNVDSWGAYITGRLTVAKNIDVVASYDIYDRNKSMDYDQTNITGGIQYWFYKKCRLQLQYTRVIRQFDDDYNSIQAQFQIAF